MNIFFLSANPEKAAKLMCNKHVVKMILESVQVLYAAYHLLDKDIKWYNPELKVYKLTHKSHPMVIWTCLCINHFNWLLLHTYYLLQEYTRRFSKSHLCMKHFIRFYKMGPPLNIPSTVSLDYLKSTFKNFATVNPPIGCKGAPICFGEQLTNCTVRLDGGEIDLINSYQEYYKYKATVIKMDYSIKQTKKRKRC
jgi:hypothetical protein